MTEEISRNSCSVTDFNALPENCIAKVLSLTSPSDSCRLSLVASTFMSAAESDTLWEKFLPSDYEDMIARAFDSSPMVFASKKELYLRLCDHPLIIDGGTKVAMRCLRLARNNSTSEHERLVYEGWLLHDTGHRGQGLAKAEDSISIQRSFEGFFLKAYVLADSNLDHESSLYVIQLLEEALRCPSDGLRKGQALNNLGSVYIDCDKLDLAADCFTNALNIKHTRANQAVMKSAITSKRHLTGGLQYSQIHKQPLGHQVTVNINISTSDSGASLFTLLRTYSLTIKTFGVYSDFLSPQLKDGHVRPSSEKLNF